MIKIRQKQKKDIKLSAHLTEEEIGRITKNLIDKNLYRSKAMDYQKVPKSVRSIYASLTYLASQKSNTALSFENESIDELNELYSPISNFYSSLAAANRDLVHQNSNIFNQLQLRQSIEEQC